MSETYNGYTNYETWVTFLWMDSDPGSQSFWEELAAGFLDNTHHLANYLKEYHEDNSPAGVTGVYSDLMGSALGAVNWFEIAEHLIDNVREAMAYDA